jgi:UDP-GlcNAc3NAcA epimerase
MKILTVLGARPQFVKAATVSRAFAAHPAATEVIVHTGQHFDPAMSDVFFDQLDIPQPDHNLGLANLSHGAMTGRMVEAIESVIRTEQPDGVLVYGDTNSTLAGALAAVKLHVPVAHVEAGLRSFNPRMPEEMNRILTDRVSALLFCPTDAAAKNLSAEGFPFPALGKQGRVTQQDIRLVGDVMCDAVRYYRERARETVSLVDWQLEEGSYALCTLHRQENTDDPARLAEIIRALRSLADQMPVVLPVHPRTRQRFAEPSGPTDLGRIRVIDPVPYLEMQRLTMGARIILTDSGGLQKEAYMHGVPCVTLRDETEWGETVSAGWNVLAGADEGRIVDAANRTMGTNKGRPALYGNGAAAKEIVSSLLEWVS